MTEKGKKGVVKAEGMSGPLKGHVSLKSGPFAGHSTRLSSQYYILDHMNAHYKRIHSAKAAVDTTPPKSTTASTLKRDQKKRESILNGEYSPRPQSARSSLHGQQQPVDLDKLSLNLEEMDFINEIVEDKKKPPSAYHHSSPRPRWHYRPPSTTQDGSTSRNGLTTQTAATSADILDKSSHRFNVPERPFTPRTLKYEGKSRLSQSRNYNPPKNRPPPIEERRTPKTRPETMYGGRREADNPMRPKSTRSLRLTPTDEIHQKSVDHQTWVNEQARQVEELTAERLKANRRKFNGETSLESNQHPEETQDYSKTNDGFNLVQSGNQPFYSSKFSASLNSRKIKEEEDELKYLEFVTDVTNDVLNRGIYSANVLKQIFEKHIQRKKGELNEVKNLLRLLPIEVFLSLVIGFFYAFTFNVHAKERQLAKVELEVLGSVNYFHY